MKGQCNFSAGCAGLTLTSVHKDLLGEAHPAAKLYRAIDKSHCHANVDTLVDCLSDFERCWG